MQSFVLLKNAPTPSSSSSSSFEAPPLPALPLKAGTKIAVLGIAFNITRIVMYAPHCARARVVTAAAGPQAIAREGLLEDYAGQGLGVRV